MPFCPDAYIDDSKTKLGYEIPFSKYFYKYKEPRKSTLIMEDIIEIDKQLDSILKELKND